MANGLTLALLATLLGAGTAQAAGIFSPAAGQPGSTAIAATSPTIRAWADQLVNYTAGTYVDAQFRTPAKALGVAGNSDGTNAGVNFDVVSLGRGGSITLGFSTPIADGTGFDFAVFENSFSDTFIELAWVEVSSDGQSFTRFPGFSLTALPVSAFGTMDPTNVEGLAGKYRGGFGTPFDLAQLIGTPGLDLGHISHVRLVDIVGDGTAVNDLNPQNLADWLGLPLSSLPPSLVNIANSAPAAIYDPYPTTGSAGFDLDAVAALNLAAVPLPASVWFFVAAFAALGTRLRRRAALGVAATLLAGTASAAVIDFDDLSLSANSHFRNASSTTFTSHGATFYYDAPFGDCCWSGFTYSNRTDTSTPGFANDGSAITGDGAGAGQDNYGIGQADGAHLEFATPQTLVGAYFTNTTYAFLAMRDGDDGNSPPFVKGPFGPGDFFTLHVKGRDAGQNLTGALDIALADGANILHEWTWVDLSALGTVKSLEFSFSSSDTGPFGVDTPSYFAIDDLTAVPGPASGWLLLSGFALLPRVLCRRSAA